MLRVPDVLNFSSHFFYSSELFDPNPNMGKTSQTHESQRDHHTTPPHTDSKPDVSALNGDQDNHVSQADPKIRGLFDSNYARSKRDMMGFVNDIRSTGAAIEVE